MQDNTEQLTRIARMQARYDAIWQAVHTQPYTEAQLRSVQAQMDALTAYYESPDWLADYDADRRGDIPKDRDRGILAEDTLYDLMTEWDHLVQAWRTGDLL